MIVPFIIATITLTGIIEVLHALRLVNKIIVSGQSLGVWLELLLYFLPTSLINIIPYTFMFAVFYGFYRLLMDNEITVMFSIGISRMRLMRPVIIFAILVSIILLSLHFFVLPFTHKTLQQRASKIDSQIANAMLRPGVFTNPARGITSFINSRDEKGFIKGIFFQDNRDKNKSTSYIAESGALINKNNKAKLIMFNGQVHLYERAAGKEFNITIVKFDRYSYDLSQLVNASPIGLESSQHLYPRQSYKKWIDPKTSKKEKANIFNSFLNVLLQVLYIINYGVIALAALLPAQINRIGYSKRIGIAVLVCIAVRFSGFLPVKYDEDILLYLASVFAIPVFTLISALFVVIRGVGVLGRLRHHFANTALSKTPIAKAASIEAV